MTPKPTQQEIDNANARKELADRERTKLEAAIEACGDGATAYGYWVIVDKVTGERLETYCCQRPGHGGWKPDPNYPDDLPFDERLTPEQHPGWELNGERFYPFRFSTYFQKIENYQPKTAEQLAQARSKRAQKKVEQLEKKAKESLFPEIYDDEIAEQAKKTT